MFTAALNRPFDQSAAGHLGSSLQRIRSRVARAWTIERQPSGWTQAVRERALSSVAAYQPLIPRPGVLWAERAFIAQAGRPVVLEPHPTTDLEERDHAAEQSLAPVRPTKALSLEREVLPFLVTARRLIETDQLVAARRMLEVAPVDVLSDRMVMRLRDLLAPPRVEPLQKLDTDRTAEYAWLRNEGEKHRGRWVALDGDTLLAEAPTLKELRVGLKMMTLARPPLLHRVE